MVETVSYQRKKSIRIQFFIEFQFVLVIRSSFFASKFFYDDENTNGLSLQDMNQPMLQLQLSIADADRKNTDKVCFSLTDDQCRVLLHGEYRFSCLASHRAV